MELSVRGWQRDCGWNKLGSIDVEKLDVSDNRILRSGCIDIDDNEISIMWGTEIRRTGNYLVILTLTRKDISRLFKLLVGEEVDAHALRKLGIRFDEKTTIDKYNNMTVKEFCRVFGSRTL